MGDGLQWYQRYSWAYFTRLNTVVLAEASLASEGLAARLAGDTGMEVEMQLLGSEDGGAFGGGEDENGGEDFIEEDSGPESQPHSGSRSEPHSRAVAETHAGMISRPAELKRCLTIWELLGYGIASTVGSGIYVVTGTVVHSTGPAIVVSFLLAAVAALLSALAYAEFAARVPLSGSAYTFAYVTLGELAAWFIGSNLTLEYSISASAVARGFSVNMAQMLSLWDAQLPAWLVGMPLNAYFDLSPLSALLIMVCTLTLCLGVQSSARFNIAMTALNVSVILFVVLLGASSMQLANFTPFVPNGYLAVLSGTGTVFFSFVGFDSVSTLAGEVKNPSRDLPLGICGTLGVATFLYVAVSVVICGMVSYQLIDISAPLSAAFQSVGLDWAASVIAVASLVALTATTLCSLLGQPRIFYQMAVDGLLWPVFSKVDSRAVPIWGTIISGGFSALIALFVDLKNLTEMISIGTLMAFALVCAGVIIIRYRPDQPLTPAEDAARTRVLPPRFIPLLVVGFTVSSTLFAASCVAQWGLWFSLPLALPPLVLYGLLQLQVPVNIPMTFSCPLVPLLPCLGILANIFIIVGLPIESAYRVIIWSVLCFIIYFAYGLHHSRLNRV